MKEKAVMVAVLIGVMLVGLIAVVGLMKEITGKTIQTTRHFGSRSCCCEIERFDYSGNSIGTEIHPLRVKTSGQLTQCNNRCQINYKGGTKRGRRSVVGYPCP